MKFVKEDEEDRRDYIFQKDTKTKFGAKFIIITLAILVAAVVASGIHFEWF
ncbi:hypothetical protein [Winogradskyella sp. SYSU M77433]|uniref:hypothetical protein n=1 Tax=Winogradskyella sp. SYSU M77433 TaxID=3042722 RepID=UPI0024818269|nr:hypothetical protein [Winogradskyella sp. SYSU M77433]MDH7912898.1 hypothetical protein [Winogradskyella sp. SYSU M77433]|tara:strand:+ start:354 stop:506 length:153 start_codon:yes stop_codon:yes gene_type:complete